MRVVPVAARGLPRPVRAQHVPLPGAHPGDVGVVHAVRPVRQGQALLAPARRGRGVALEQAQLDEVGVLRDHRHVDPVA